ncbi:hypothetical protein GWI33_005805 [Rhynchophorus ferrugineus]|uniref:Uncharacterized protein n=1 Tax=Rhynchophorus ferrugineus TaxID=354439 RepID=A0A834IJY0_RHYFE|nr:hypothetical protein GWI33_005805 [Rhynchophorus ferrugineus]
MRAKEKLMPRTNHKENKKYAATRPPSTVSSDDPRKSESCPKGLGMRGLVVGTRKWWAEGGEVGGSPLCSAN